MVQIAQVLAANTGFGITVSACDLDRVRLHVWRTGKKGRSKTLYAYNEDGEFLHRFILEAPAEMDVDHKNGNGLDCRRENLRLCTASQNGCNRGPQKNNACGLKGVAFYKRTGRWRATIKFEKKCWHLGYFDSPTEAHEVYKAAALRHHGEFAKW